MIKDKIGNLSRYQINEAFEQFKKHMASGESPETVTLPLKAIPLTYETGEHNLSKFETHRKFIDIHYLIEGEEAIGITQIENLNPNMEYDDAGDYQLFDGQVTETLILSEGEFLLLYPNEGHVTAGVVSEKRTVKKIVFKVPV